MHTACACEQVGEIYDEDDDDEVAEDTTSVVQQADGSCACSASALDRPSPTHHPLLTHFHCAIRSHASHRTPPHSPFAATPVGT